MKFFDPRSRLFTYLGVTKLEKKGTIRYVSSKLILIDYTLIIQVTTIPWLNYLYPKAIKENIIKPNLPELY